ncbi:bifunctional metallophosphatase/5'-nucleotidase [Nocardioides caldifontis]|uniref:bifunctional metallophosphatase/5'-nucleotidase n=1 Tax=Nocardioides caldifontis TaxID=2588938 RepID=UPI00193AD115|nr:bifunctional metallophosphatase/5'-nucleotidase [Nocardioides caldifontis]
MTPLPRPSSRGRHGARRTPTPTARTALAGLVAVAVASAPLALAGGAAAAPERSPDGTSETAPDAAPGVDTAPAEKPRKPKRKPPLKLQLLALNDFHGQLEQVSPTSSSGNVNGTPAGGVAYLASHLRELRQEARAKGWRSMTVAAGDLIGATPLLSAAFHDEPTIEAMNMLGLDVASVGNHEFDEGYRELLRMQRGGCLADGDGAANQNSCPDPTRPFTGADFQYLAANVKYASNGKTILPPFSVRKVRGVKVGFIGMTLENTPNIVTKAGVQGLRFTDEVRTVRQLMPKLRKRGVKSIVVLLHEGGVPEDRSQYVGCAGVSGDGYDIARRLPAAVDLVVSGHTHEGYTCTVRDPKGNPRLFTSAESLGRIVTDIRLRVDRSTGDVIRPKVGAFNHLVRNADGTAPRPALLRLIDRYTTLVEPIANEVLGELAPAGTQNALPKPGTVTEDFALGNLIADSQLADDSVVTDAGDPVIAFMNPGGIRTSLEENAQGEVTYGAAFAVQPFNNYVTSMTLTGEQVLAVLEEQWNGLNEGSPKVLQVAGLSYTYDAGDAAAAGTDAVVDGSVEVDTDGDGVTDTPLDPAEEYRVVVNSFLSDGGDGFGTLAEGTDKYIGGLDIDALAEYLGINSPYTPPAEDRITVQP